VSELLDIAGHIVDDRDSAFADTVTNLRTGLTFRAELQGISDLELMTELGADPRASHWLHVRDKTADIQANDRLSVLGVTLQILPGHVPDNVLSPQRRFTAMQLTANDA
jgi:hypothetical protein